MSTLTTSLRRRLLTSNATATALAVTAGMYTLATLAAALSLTEAQTLERFVLLGQQRNGGTRQRGVEMVLLGVGTADTTTVTARVWQVKRGLVTDANGRKKLAADFELALLYNVVGTLSTATGASGGELVTATEKLADGVAVTQYTSATSPAGVADKSESMYGAAAAGAMSHAGNTPGRFFLPDAGNGDLFIELIVTSGTSANALVEAVV